MKQRKRRCDPGKQTQWEAVVRRWKESGRSVREYCRTEGLRESAFYFWRRELTRRGQPLEAGGQPRRSAEVLSAPQPAKRSPASRLNMPAFLPVRVVESTGAKVPCGVEIVLDHGRTVRVLPGFDRQTLVDVLSVLEVRPC
jgi:transposase-like protein